jgi:hypothetical protein
MRRHCVATLKYLLLTKHKEKEKQQLSWTLNLVISMKTLEKVAFQVKLTCTKIIMMKEEEEEKKKLLQYC